MAICELCDAELQADGRCPNCNADDGWRVRPPSHGWISIDLSGIGAATPKVLERIRDHWAFMDRVSIQRLLPEQQIPSQVTEPFVMFGTSDTYAYIRDEIRSEFALDAEWIRYTVLTKEAAEAVKSSWKGAAPQAVRMADNPEESGPM